MKNKNGFTLVEVTICVVIISILSIVVGSRIVDSNQKAKEKIYDAKLKVALASAVSYGKDNLDELTSACKNTTIGELIKLNYLETDSGNEYEYIDPRDNSSMINKIICIKIVNNEVKANLE